MDEEPKKIQLELPNSKPKPISKPSSPPVQDEIDDKLDAILNGIPPPDLNENMSPPVSRKRKRPGVQIPDYKGTEGPFLEGILSIFNKLKIFCGRCVHSSDHIQSCCCCSGCYHSRSCARCC